MTDADLLTANMLIIEVPVVIYLLANLPMTNGDNADLLITKDKNILRADNTHDGLQEVAAEMISEESDVTDKTPLSLVPDCTSSENILELSTFVTCLSTTNLNVIGRYI